MNSKNKRTRLLQKLDALDFKSTRVGAERLRELMSLSSQDFSPDAYRIAGAANTAAKLGYTESDIAKNLSLDIATLRKLMKRYPEASISVRDFLKRPSSKAT